MKRSEPMKERETPLKGRRVAILATDGFEESELSEPRDALNERTKATAALSVRSLFARGVPSARMDRNSIEV